MIVTLVVLNYLSIGMIAGRICFRHMWKDSSPRFVKKTVRGCEETVPVKRYAEARAWTVGWVLIWPLYSLFVFLYGFGLAVHWLLTHTLLRPTPIERKASPGKSAAWKLSEDQKQPAISGEVQEARPSDVKYICPLHTKIRVPDCSMCKRAILMDESLGALDFYYEQHGTFPSPVHNTGCSTHPKIYTQGCSDCTRLFEGAR